MKKILVHSFLLSDTEDPEIFAAEPILEFEQTERGQWLHEHSELQMTYDILNDPMVMGYRVLLHAWLSDEDLTFYNLKWS